MLQSRINERGELVWIELEPFTKPLYEGMPPWEMAGMPRATWEENILIASIAERLRDRFWGAVGVC